MILAMILILFALMMLAWRTRNDDILLSSIIISAVWAAWVSFIVLTENYEPWQFGIFVDALAAHVLLLPGYNRNRVILACLYAVQIAIHISYGWVKVAMGKEPWELYGEALDAVALIQLCIVGGWVGLDLLRGRGIHPLDRGAPDYSHYRKAGREK